MATTPLTNTISKNYKILKVVGQGCYGQVLHCFKEDTKENVAVKVLKKRHRQDVHLRELYMLDKLVCLDPDKYNIVRCHEWFHKIDQTFMVFEMLDMSIYDYMCKTKSAPFPLNGIRTIIKDVAMAIKGLKGMGLIHTDIKLDNIMLVNHQKQPFRVKLIDFGLTMETREMCPGLTVQPLWNRAPEVIVGFPFNEAIDVWSLGAIMAEILLGFPLFPGRHEYDLRFIIAVLGELPKRLLNEGMNTLQYYYGRHKYFMFLYWTLKMPLEYFAETGIKPEDRRKYKFSSLDDLKTFNQHRENEEEAADRSACVELLKKMLQLDPKNRITPSKILEHGFILGSEPSPSNQPQAVEDKKTDLPKHEDDGDCVLTTICDTVSDSGLIMEATTCRVTRSPSLDSDIESIRLDSPNSNDGTEDNSPTPLEDSEPKKKGLRRFFSTLKRNLFSCFCVPKGNNE